MGGWWEGRSPVSDPRGSLLVFYPSGVTVPEVVLPQPAEFNSLSTSHDGPATTNRGDHHTTPMGAKTGFQSWHHHAKRKPFAAATKETFGVPTAFA